MTAKDLDGLISDYAGDIRVFEQSIAKLRSDREEYERRIQVADKEISERVDALKLMNIKMDAYMEASAVIERESQQAFWDGPLEKLYPFTQPVSRIERLRQAIYEKPGRYKELGERAGVKNHGSDLRRLQRRGVVKNVEGVWSPA